MGTINSYIIAALVLALALMTAAFFYEKSQVSKQIAINASIIEKMTASALNEKNKIQAASDKIVNEYISKIKEIENENYKLEDRIKNAPKSTKVITRCVDSPPIRALIDGLQPTNHTPNH
jgi:hypothetical protein